MHRYLDIVDADYDYLLEIAPSAVLSNIPDKPQITHEFADGRQAVVDLSGQKFTVELQWDYLSETDRETILDLFHDPSKANGRDRTFYWKHPRDGWEYTVHFLTPLRTVYKPGHVQSIETMKLRLIGATGQRYSDYTDMSVYVESGTYMMFI